MDIGTALTWQYPTAVPGTDYAFSDDGQTITITTWNETLLGPRPASYAALQTWADSKTIDILKYRKQNELESKFQEVWDGQFGNKVAVGLTIYFDFPNDTRTVNVKNAKANFLSKTNTLNDLGRPGKPPLTEANIAAIVW